MDITCSESWNEKGEKKKVHTYIYNYIYINTFSFVLVSLFLDNCPYLRFKILKEEWIEMVMSLNLVNPNILSSKASSAPPSPWWRHLNKSQLTRDSTQHILTNNDTHTHRYIYIYMYVYTYILCVCLCVTSGPATCKRAKTFMWRAPYHHDYSYSHWSEV